MGIVSITSLSQSLSTTSTVVLSSGMARTELANMPDASKAKHLLYTRFKNIRIKN
jgi:hypothetical protein